MTTHRRMHLISAAVRAAAILVLVALPMAAQQAKQAGAKKDKPKRSAYDTVKYSPTKLFASNDPLTMTLTMNVKQITKDRTGTTPWRPASLTYEAPDSPAKTVPIQVQTRGIWRRKNCDIPPIRLDLPKDSVKKTVLGGQNHIKITIPCRNKDDYEQMILQEANLYRVYNLLTPFSHRMRLVKLTINDSASAKAVMTRWAFVTESSEEVAARNGGVQYDVKGASNGDLESKTATIVGLFQYLIGNTDFSVPGLHNVELVAKQADIYPIVYDFDWTGVVNPPYGFPDSRLAIKRLTEHLFRGPCGSAADYAPTVELFKSKKAEIWALYSVDVGKRLDAGRNKETLEFFEDFYKTITNDRDARRNIGDVCKNS